MQARHNDHNGKSVTQTNVQTPETRLQKLFFMQKQVYLLLKVIRTADKMPSVK